MIPTDVHEPLDKAASTFDLLTQPCLARKTCRPPRAFRLSGGAGAATISLTDYKLGAVRAIPMAAHL